MHDHERLRGQGGQEPVFGPKEATETTRRANRAAAAGLPIDDRRDFALARRGMLAPPADPVVRHAAGHAVWDLGEYAFLDDPVPDTVHPGLWRQAQLNAVAGLFEVAAGIYQVRGLDLSNVTFVAGDTGWIVVDPLTSTETAAAALALLSAHLGERPVRAVVYTHSHVDHFAGVYGVVTAGAVARGEVAVVAPAGFLEAAVSENVIAGNAMRRRGMYMYGALLPRGPHGHVDAGLGKAVPSLASSGLLAPTDEVVATGEHRVLDGVRLVFQVTPGTEAPAEMNFYLPDRAILCMAENCTATLHNVYTPRGAQVRDALAWSRYIDDAISLFGDAEIVFASHHWPRWGNDEAMAYLGVQRDTYRYLHDQTMRLANHGLTMLEIAEELELPASLRDEFFNRDYYGTVNHNAKAVYQRYLGWFDGNPAHLHGLPPTEVGRRYVELLGGADEVVRQGRRAFEAGDYRWVVELVNHVVFSDPGHAAARALQADALEQLGYQAESGPWRGFYLTGAHELRAGGPPVRGLSAVGLDAGMASAMPTGMLFDYLAVRLNGPAAQGWSASVGVVVGDRREEYVLVLEHATLRHRPGSSAAPASPDVVVTLDYADLVALVLGDAGLEELSADGGLHVEGDVAVLSRLLGLLDSFDPFFDIVLP